MLRLLWGPLIFIGVLSCLAALSLRILTRPEPPHVHVTQMLDEKILGSPSGWQTVSLLDGGRTGRYYDAPEDFIRARGQPVSSALLLGLGGGEMLRSVRRASPNAWLLGVEIDPRVVALAVSEFGIPSLGQLTIVVADAVEWVKTPRPTPVDVVMVDLFNDAEIVAEVFAPSFWSAVRALLAPSGLLIVNAWTTGNAASIKLAMGEEWNVTQVAYGANTLLIATQHATQR